jgi:thioredoxin reductase
VVLAVGVLPFAHRPAVLAGLAPQVSTHSSEHHRLDGFRGRDVAVVGGGQSALEIASLLGEVGARPRLVARADRLRWNSLPITAPRPGLDRIRSPESALGVGWGNWAWSNLPPLFRYLPGPARRHVVRTALGPEGAWWLKDRVLGEVPMTLGRALSAATHRDRVRLTVTGDGGAGEVVEADHVIACTGYVVDVRRLRMLDPALRSRVRLTGTAPRLSAGFETSVPGLYTVGLMSAQSFGPAMRFVYGAEFTARRLARHLLSSPAMPRGRRG